MAFKFYSIAIPIGHYDDISLRALDAFKKVEILFCEDSRKAKKIFNYFNISLPHKVISIPGDKEFSYNFEKVLDNSKSNVWGFISDAGTPGINDPGSNLLKWCEKKGFEIFCLPGASSLTTAIQRTGGFGLPFYFSGFVPKVKKEADKSLENFLQPLNYCKTFICFITKFQILNFLDFLVKNHRSIEIKIIRDITKNHEEVLHNSPENLAKIFKEKIKEKKVGELTVVLEGSPRTTEKKKSLAELETLLTGKPRDASKIISDIFKISTQDAYKKLISIDKHK